MLEVGKSRHRSELRLRNHSVTNRSITAARRLTALKDGTDRPRGRLRWAPCPKLSAACSRLGGVSAQVRPFQARLMRSTSICCAKCDRLRHRVAEMRSVPRPTQALAIDHFPSCDPQSSRVERPIRLSPRSLMICLGSPHRLATIVSTNQFAARENLVFGTNVAGAKSFNSSWAQRTSPLYRPDGATRKSPIRNRVLPTNAKTFRR